MTGSTATHPNGAGGLMALGGRVMRAIRGRAGRLRVALLVFVLLLPLLLTMFLGEGR